MPYLKLIESQTQSLPTDGLIFHAPLDSGKATAETGQALTKFGTVSYLKKEGVKCARFDGSSYLALTPSGNEFKFGTKAQWTLCFHVYFERGLDAAQDLEGLFCSMEPNGSYTFFIYRYIQGWSASVRNSLGVGINTVNEFTTPADAIESGKWLFVAIERSGSAVRIRINDTWHSGGSSSNVADADILYLPGGSPKLAGYFADLRIFDKVLSEDEITAVKASVFTPANCLLAGDACLLVDGICLPLEPFEYEADTAAGIFEAIQSTTEANKSKSYTLTAELSRNITEVYPGWSRSVLAPNGKIYSVPIYSGYILIFDPANKTHTTMQSPWGDSNKTSWNSAVLDSDGKIYFIPYDTKRIVRIDPDAETETVVLTFEIAPRFTDSVYAPNGKIYCIPGYYSHLRSLTEIDLVKGAVTTFGEAVYGDFAVTAPNKKIYIFGPSLWELDPDAKIVTEVSGVTLPSDWSYVRGILAPNGKIYCIGHSILEGAISNTLFEFDPETKMLAQTGFLSPVLYSRLLLAPNGKIYGFPFSGLDNLLEIDPDTKTMTVNHDFSNLDLSYIYGAAVHPDGCMYVVGRSSNTTTISYLYQLAFTGDLTPFPAEVCESSYLNSR